MAKTTTTKTPAGAKAAQVRVTCYSHESYEPLGGTRTLATFRDGTDVLDQQPALSKALDWLDDLLQATNDFSLHDELGKIRKACDKSAGKAGDDHVFRGNADVPLCIVNLVLDKYGLEIEEDG